MSNTDPSLESLLHSRRRWKIAALTSWGVLAVLSGGIMLLALVAVQKSHRALAIAEDARMVADSERQKALDAHHQAQRERDRAQEAERGAAAARKQAEEREKKAREDEQKAKEQVQRQIYAGRIAQAYQMLKDASGK